jgi:hypothetical protein
MIPMVRKIRLQDGARRVSAAAGVFTASNSPCRAPTTRRRKHGFALAVLTLGAILTAGFSGATGVLAAGTRSQRPHTPIAKEASELKVRESAHLHLVSHHHEVIVEEGHASGTLNGKLVIHLTLAYTHGSVTFTAYPPGGTIVGRGEGSSSARGTTAYFTGTASVTGGTGKYAHVSADNVQLRGTLQRETFAFFVEFTATLRY